MQDNIPDLEKQNWEKIFEKLENNRDRIVIEIKWKGAR